MKNVLFNQYIYFKKEGIQNVEKNFKLGIMCLYACDVRKRYGICGSCGYFG